MSWVPIDEPEESGERKSTYKNALQSISALIPADATAFYLTALNFVSEDQQTAGYLWTATFISLGLGILFRLLAKAPILLHIITVISFFVWVYGIGGGIFETMDIQLGPIGGLIIFGYSAVMTMLITFKVIKV